MAASSTASSTTPRSRITGTRQHRRLRRVRAGPIRERLHAWLVRQKPLHPPKSPIATAIRYALNQRNRRPISGVATRLRDRPRAGEHLVEVVCVDPQRDHPRRVEARATRGPHELGGAHDATNVFPSSSVRITRAHPRSPCSHLASCRAQARRRSRRASRACFDICDQATAERRLAARWLGC
jgi:hypothetical protein